MADTPSTMGFRRSSVWVEYTDLADTEVPSDVDILPPFSKAVDCVEAPVSVGHLKADALESQS